MDHTQLWKILQEMRIPDYCPASWEICMQVKKQQLDTEKWSGSKLGKVYIKAIYCHLAYLTYAECIIWNAKLDEAQAGIKIAGRNNNLRYAANTTLLAERGTKKPFDEDERGELKSWLKTP